MAGYSNKTLKEKLGLKQGMRTSFVNPPPDYSELLGAVDWSEVDLGTEADFIHVFYTGKRQLELDAKQLELALAKGGILWVSWPKKSSGVKADISENDLRDILLPIGLVDVKVAAITEIWSGLKFLRRVVK
jgi:hypothetical protein